MASFFLFFVSKRLARTEKKKKKDLISNVLMFHTYIDFFIIVSLTQVMQYGSFVEMSQVGHVFDFLKFRWIGR